MASFNALLRSAFDSLLEPFQDGSPLIVLIPVSVLTAVFALWVYKRFSRQDDIAAVKDQMFAGIFEIRLFNDDLRLISRATGTILRHSLRYFWLSFYPAFLIMLPPIVLVIAQLQFHYGYEGFEPGQQVLLEVDLAPPAGQEAFPAGAPKPATSLTVPDGFRQETPAVWAPTENLLVWRLAVTDTGISEIGITVDGETVTKRIVASPHTVRRSPIRVDGGFWDQLIFPAEAPLPPQSRIASIRLDYPTTTISFLWIDWNWLILYIVLMVVFGFALAKPMRVTV
ncbi:MAG: hypothetical protein R3244_13080 [Thermoanaerobaculia bacterium]|nr:hypothetical protein [Thermoanaerobaculia bacterium]